MAAPPRLPFLLPNRRFHATPLSITHLYQQFKSIYCMLWHTHDTA